MKNPKYTGTYVFFRMKSKNVDGKRNSHAYKDDEDIIKVDGAVPALVSKEDFERVQECMKVRKHQAAKHTAKRTYLLSGKIYCGECGMTKDIDSIVSVIVKTSSDSLVEKLNELDNRKKELTEKLRSVEAQCQTKELTEEELLYSFNQAREMLKSGELSTVKALIERYVQKVIVNGEHIEVQFNLNVNSRLVTYPADISKNKKQIPQFALQQETEVFDSSQMLATFGAGGGT